MVFRNAVLTEDGKSLCQINSMYVSNDDNNKPLKFVSDTMYNIYINS